MFRYSKSKLREGVTRITDGIVNEFLIVKGFPGHTPGSITLLDPAPSLKHLLYTSIYWAHQCG